MAQQENDIHKLMKAKFIELEDKYQKWFFANDRFIDDYFVENDFRKGFVENSVLPDKIKKDSESIKSTFGFKYY